MVLLCFEAGAQGQDWFCCLLKQELRDSRLVKDKSCTRVKRIRQKIDNKENAGLLLTILTFAVCPHRHVGVYMYTYSSHECTFWC